METEVRERKALSPRVDREPEEPDFTTAFLGLPSPAEVADHPNLHKGVPKGTRALWIQTWKSVGRAFQKAVMLDDGPGVVAAGVSMLQLPGRVLEFRRELNGRIRNTVINDDIQALLHEARPRQHQTEWEPTQSPAPDMEQDEEDKRNDLSAVRRCCSLAAAGHLSKGARALNRKKMLDVSDPEVKEVLRKLHPPQREPPPKNQRRPSM